jgi:hypothetical protein
VRPRTSYTDRFAPALKNARLMACGAELGDQLFLQTKPTAISGDSPRLDKAESNQEASLSFR